MSLTSTIRLFIILALIVLWLPMVQAAPPTSVQLSARIFDGDAGFSYQGGVEVRLLETGDTDTVLWTETFADVETLDGWLSVELGVSGNQTPGSLAPILTQNAGRALAFQVYLVDEDLLLPGKLRVTSVPYALSAGDAQSIQGMEADAFSFAGHDHAWDEITDKPEEFPPVTHDHDDLYYTETEIDTRLEGFSESTHSHLWSEIQQIPEGFADGVDDDTQYSAVAGSGLEIANGTISLSTQCSDTQVLHWNAALSGWECTTIGGSSTVYTAMIDRGIEVSGTEIGLIATCADGEILRWNNTNQNWECSTDADTQYNPATGGGMVISANEIGLRTDCGADQVLAWNALEQQWDCVLIDTTGTTYSAMSGRGIEVSGTEIGLVGNCNEGNVLRWNDTSQLWNCDTDADTLYSATTGGGLYFDGTQVGLLPGCTDGQVLKWDLGGSTWYCATDLDNDTTYGVQTNRGLEITGNDFGLLSTCGRGEVLKWDSEIPAWICAPDESGTGDVTGVTAGDGLTGGGTSGDLSLAVNFDGDGSSTQVSRSDHLHDWSELQSIPSGFVDGVDDDTTYSGDATNGIEIDGSNAISLIKSCSPESVLKYTGTSWICEPYTTSSGDITDVIASTGLTGGGDAGSVSLAVDFDSDGSSSQVARSDHQHDWSELQSIPSGFSDGVDNDTTYSVQTNRGLEMNGTQFGLLSTCDDGYILKWDQSGSFWECRIDEVGSGDVTGVTAGNGLTGGGTSGDLNLAVNFDTNGSSTQVSRSDHLHDWSEIQTIPSGFADGVDNDTIYSGDVTNGIEIDGSNMIGLIKSCSANSILKFSGSSWICETYAPTSGDVTGVTAGDGLTGGGTSGDLSLAVNFDSDGTSTQASRSDHGHSWSELQSVPSGFSDGVDDDTTYDVLTNRGLEMSGTDFGLLSSCEDGYVLKWNISSTAWECGIDSVGPDITAAETLTGNWVNTTYPWADNEVADNLTISGGSIDNTEIGATTPAGATLSTLEVQGDASLGISSSDLFTVNAGSVSFPNVSGSGFEMTIGGTNLYSPMSSTLQTDGSMVVGQDLTVGDDTNDTDVWIVAKQGISPDGILRYSSGADRFEVSNDGGAKFRMLAEYSQTIHVYSTGDSAADGERLLNTVNGITGASATSPYLVKIGPGEFDLQNASLYMQQYVDIEGSGQGMTFITSDSHSGVNAGTIVGNNNSQLRHLSIKNRGGGTFATAFYSEGVSPSLLYVSIETGNAGNCRGITHTVASMAGSLMLDHVSITVTGDDASHYGITIEGNGGTSENMILEMVDSTISVLGSDTTTAQYGIYAYIAEVSIRNSRIKVRGDMNATAVGVLSNNGISTTVTDSEIELYECSSYTAHTFRMIETAKGSIRGSKLSNDSSGDQSMLVSNQSSIVGVAYNLYIDHSVLYGNQSAITASAGGPSTHIYFGSSQVSAGAKNGTTGQILCAQCYSESYTELSNYCY